MTKRNAFFLATVAVACLFVTASIAEAQRAGGGRRGGGGPGFLGGFGVRGGTLELLQRDDVREELTLTDSQLGEIETLRQESREGRRGQFQAFQNFREMSEEERSEAVAKMQEQRLQQQQELRAKVGKILNSSQRSRLSELEFQFQLQRGSARGALEAAGIELNEKDQHKLSEAQEEVQARLREQIAEIQRKAQVEILMSVISENQIGRMAGEEFEFSANQRPGRFGAGERGERAAGTRRDRARRRPAAEDEDEAESTGRQRRRR